MKRPPQTLEAARSEVSRLERRIRSDQKRVEELVLALGDLHSGHKLPAAGSKWIRTMDLGYRRRGVPRTIQTPYEFVAYAHTDASGGPVLVFLGTYDGRQQHTAVSLQTFYREFDPAPVAAKKARARRREAS